mmetsp:Transcript_10698/g.19366  ORF Transcript_10698/g.19366 Transcript_10698/m.19366 type:complete len:218 (+) Transcript_10698:1322-1975(+)
METMASSSNTIAVARRTANIANTTSPFLKLTVPLPSPPTPMELVLVAAVWITMRLVLFRMPTMPLRAWSWWMTVPNTAPPPMNTNWKRCAPLPKPYIPPFHPAVSPIPSRMTNISVAARFLVLRLLPMGILRLLTPWPLSFPWSVSPAAASSMSTLTKRHKRWHCNPCATWTTAIPNLNWRFQRWNWKPNARKWILCPSASLVFRLDRLPFPSIWVL